MGSAYVRRLVPPLITYVRMASWSGSFQLKDTLLVMPSALMPVSVISTTVGAVKLMSRVKFNLALAVLPAVSVSVTTTKYSSSFVGAV